MIHPDSQAIEWMKQVSIENDFLICSLILFSFLNNYNRAQSI